MPTVSVDAGLAGLLSTLTLLAAVTYGPYRAGRWIGQWWWVLAGLVIPTALVRYWAPAYVDAVPSLSPTGWVWLFVLQGAGMLLTVIAAGLAAVGVGQTSTIG
jgi:hypothetical protein